VNDQERMPTHASDLARGIESIIEKKAKGIFNLCGKNILTPYEMAMATADYLDIKDHHLTAVSTKELHEVAERPLKSGLCIDKARKELGYEPMSFEEGLKRTLS